jgi:hypothetical protein
MANLLGGTRIYGAANVDYQITIGGSTGGYGTANGGVLITNTAIYFGNSTVNTALTASGFGSPLVLNSNLTVNAAVILGGLTGTAGQVLISNGTSAPFWGAGGFSNGQSVSVSFLAANSAVVNTAIVLNGNNISVGNTTTNTVINSANINIGSVSINSANVMIGGSPLVQNSFYYSYQFVSSMLLGGM